MSLCHDDCPSIENIRYTYESFHIHLTQDYNETALTK